MAFCALLLAAVLAAAPAAEAQWRDSYPVLRIGIAGGDNLALAGARAEPFRRYLENALGVSVEILPAADYGTLIADQLTGRFHVTFLSASAFAAASAACDGCVQPLVVPTTLEGEAGYRAALIVPAGSAIAGPDDLVGSRLAVSAEDSLAGRLLPLALFAEAGIDVATITLVPRDAPAEAVRAMTAGEADAALGWIGLSDDPGDRGVLAQLASSGALLPVDVGVVWTSPAIMHGPLTVLGRLPASLKADLAEAVVLMAGVDRDALLAVNGAMGGAFVPVEAADYDPLMILADPG